MAHFLSLYYNFIYLFVFFIHFFFFVFSGMQDLFEITLEATHHGPYVELPTCFVEIGRIMMYVIYCILLCACYS